MAYHEHYFQDCGYDEQQCDNACRATHVCGVCKKTRSEVAKDTEDVRAYVETATRAIITMLEQGLKAPTLEAMVEVIDSSSTELDYLSREQLVEMAVSREKRA